METSDEYDSEELHALNCFVAGLSELGYGWAMGVLDAEFFGVPQRRRRVFVVGCLGNWAAAYAVLFDSHSLSGNSPPRREKGQAVAGTIGGSSQDGGFRTTDLDNNGAFITHSLRADGFDASEDGTGRGTPLVVGSLNCNTGPNGHDAGNFACNQAVDAGHIIPILEAGARTGKSTDDPRAGMGVGEAGDPMFTLQSGKQHAIAFSAKDHGADAMDDCSPTLRAGGHTDSHANAGVMPAVCTRTAQTSANGHGIAEDVSHGAIQSAMAVRRLTPRECERLQGFEDDFTRIPWRGKPAEECPDGPRYKAIGNSWAVPCLRWIGERLVRVDRLLRAEEVL